MREEAYNLTKWTANPGPGTILHSKVDAKRSKNVKAFLFKLYAKVGKIILCIAETFNNN